MLGLYSYEGLCNNKLQKIDVIRQLKYFSNVKKRIKIVLLLDKGVIPLKLTKYVSFLLVLMCMFVGYQIVSMSHYHHSVSHGGVVGVENEVSFTTVDHHQDEKKHPDYLGNLFIENLEQATVIVVLLTLLLSVLTLLIQKLFLKAVYYQSSYYSNHHCILT